jgi:ribonucleoside-diphosphate reductase beta chain
MTEEKTEIKNLLERRITYRPFLYPKAYDYFLKQQQAHWLFTEVAMNGDIKNWKFNLTDSEKSVIGGVLKGFIQMETLVGEYWSSKIVNWFKHPEIVMMATTFSSFEAIHTAGYAYLNDSLGIEDYDAFLYEPTAKAKIERLLHVENTNDKSNIAKSLAIFSGFVEGVSLFSSFAILLNFSRFNKLKGVGQIIGWSILDESLHSEAGCWLFREFIKENPEIWTDELKKEIYEAARITISIEDNFIDKVFEKGEIEGISVKDVKQFIRNRANTKLGDLGLKTNWKNIDQEIIAKMGWFDTISSGLSQTDFFDAREVAYSKGSVSFDKIFG